MPNLISLSIRGNINPDGGFVPLVSVGPFPKDEIEDMDSGTSINEKVCYIIKHKPDSIIYMIKDSAVRSAKGSRDGSLVIGIAIPVKTRLKDGKSPYQLLKAVYETYVQDNMVPLSDGFHRFIEKDEIPRDPYLSIIATYELEDYERPIYVLMGDHSPKGIVCVQDEKKLEELMSDSQYLEFKNFSQIEIGFSCNPTINIEIPRKQEYRIILNDEDINCVLSAPSDIFSSKSRLRDTRTTTYEDSHVAFSLQQLLQAPNYTLYEGRVRLESNNIICKVEGKDRPYEYIVDIKPHNAGSLKPDIKSKVIELLKNGKIHIFISTDDITRAFYDEQKVILYSSLLEEEPRINPVAYTDDALRYQFTISKNNIQGYIYLYVETSPIRSSSTTHDGVVHSGYSPIVQTRKPSGPGNQGEQILKILFLNGEPMTPYRVYVSTSDGQNRLVQDLSFTKHGTGSVAQLVFGLDWRGLLLQIELRKYNSSNLDEYEYSRQEFTFFTNNNVAKYDINTLRFTEQETKPRSKKKGLILGILAAALLLLGGIAGWGITNLWNSRGQNNATNDSENAALRHENSRLKKEYEKLASAKTQDSLNFQSEATKLNQQIENLKQPSSINHGNDSGQSSSVGLNTKDAQIVDAVNNRNWGNLQKLINNHREVRTLERLYFGNKKTYTSAQLEKRDKILKGQQFKKIEEIVEFTKKNIINNNDFN